ncbi:tetratricopeptide repeat protein [Corynebacterium tapiri]|uniref:Tetratricopeptide repeat protein n=1 Tax=Corynebacterium tapiri TaxID=1448266 RepID=A0A5C4U4S7_9CORY|nr:hypothetical protein [Corynebacterium tapiri]TNL97665.1 hypothetical protein FHE74_06160 [Corynebacterium tapiri]
MSDHKKGLYSRDGGKGKRVRSGRNAGHQGRKGDVEKRERSSNRRYGPSRPRYREERMERRNNEPDLPEGIDIKDLDPLVLQDLQVLAMDNADAVAKHMITAIDLLEDDPKLALRHARAAKERAGRVGVAREVNGIVAYRAGEWKEALAELRAARRISGGPGMLAVMADCERGLGRPEKAIELGRSEEARLLDQDSHRELAIVVAGARLDMDQAESAVVTLERLDPQESDASESGVRLNYAYADALLQAGRVDDARRWFEVVLQADALETTDAASRLAALDEGHSSNAAE